MYTLFNNNPKNNLLGKLLTLSFILFNLNGFAQVTVTTVISGQITPKITVQELKEKLLVSASSMGDGDALLDMQIMGDNGISFHIDPLKRVDVVMPITLSGMGGDLDDLFNASNLIFANEDSQKAFFSFLPSGIYELCFRAYSYDGPPLSGDPPSGCVTVVVPEVKTTVVTSFMAPYTLPLSQFANRTSVMVNSNADVDDGFLTMLIAGDNGITIQSNTMVVEYLFVEKNTTLVLTAGNVAGYFEESNLAFSGISADDAMDKGLPPGNYDICFRLWADFNEPLSGPPPSGCFGFSIEPPTGSVNLVTQVLPPYVSFFEAYAEKTMVTLTSTINQQVKLSLSLTGDNGVSLTTLPDFSPSEFIELTQGAAYVAGAMELDEYFNTSNLSISGISTNQLLNQGLPEGNYQLCFQALSSDNSGLSPEFPGGCNFFTINYPEPPQLIAPLCGDSIQYEGMQNIVFTWSLSPGASLSTEYILKIVEINDPGTDANAAMLTASSPSFFEETVSSTSLFYGPGQPILEKGRKYAWQVVAIDDGGGTQFQNNGKSEVCSFIYGKPDDSDFFYTAFTNTNDTKNPYESALTGTDLKLTPFATVKGVLKYKFYSDQVDISDVVGGQSNASITPVMGFGSSGTSGNTSQGTTSYNNARTSNAGRYQTAGFTSQGATGVSFYDNQNLGSFSASGTSIVNSIQVTDPSIYTSGYLSPKNSKALGGIKLSLQMMYLGEEGLAGYTGSNGKAIIYPIDPGSAQSDCIALVAGTTASYSTVATTTTNSDGSFSFFFPHSLKTGYLGEYGCNLPGKDIGDFRTLSGRVHRVLRIIVESPYYCSPDINIKVQPNETADLGSVVSLVRSYNLEVNVINSNLIQALEPGKPIIKVKTWALSKGARNNQIPVNEGNARKKNKKKETQHWKRLIISEGATNEKGQLLFTNLVMPDNIADQYYIYAETGNREGFITYKPGGKNNVVDDFKDSRITNKRFELKIYTDTLVLDPTRPRIIGRVQDAAYNKPVPEAVIRLKSVYPPSQSSTGQGKRTVYNQVLSDNSGYFEFNDLDVRFNNIGALVGPGRKLKVWKTGYNDYDLPTPLPSEVQKASGAKSSVDGILLNWGQQLNLLSEIKLQPKGRFKGEVTDEKGNAVKAKIRLDNGKEIETNTVMIPIAISNSGGSSGNSGVYAYANSYKIKETFDIPTKGGEQEIVIVPNDYNGFSTETYTVNIKNSGTTEYSNPFKVYVKKHKLAFYVLGEVKGYLKGLKGVKVKILDKELTTGQNGEAYFEFSNAASSFEVSIIPPEEMLFMSRKFTINSKNSKEVKDYFKLLAPATRIYGKVTVGKNKSPVNEARVYVETGANALVIENRTRADGMYSLKVPLYPEKSGDIVMLEKDIQQNVSISNFVANNSAESSSRSSGNSSLSQYLFFAESSSGNSLSTKPAYTVSESVNTQYAGLFDLNTNYTLRINAVKSSNSITYVGDYKVTSIPRNDSVNFNLTVYNNMNITRILDFPVEILELKEISSTAIKVKGSFHSLNENENFSLKEVGSKLPFGWIDLKAGSKKDSLNIPYAVPTSKNVSTQMPELHLSLYQHFDVLATPATGQSIKVERASGDNGLIKGKVKILPVSFEIDQGTFQGDFLNKLYLGKSGTSEMNIEILKSEELGLYEKGKFGLMNDQGKDLNFKYLNFNAKSDHLTSYILDNKLHLNSSLSIDLPKLKSTDATINVGEIVVSNKEVAPINGSKSLVFNLENWEVTLENWFLSKQSGAIKAPKGNIKTQFMTVPVTTISLYPNSLDIGKAVLSEFTLAKVANLTIDQSNTVYNFDYDNEVGADASGHWTMSLIGQNGNAAASLKGLPGMAAADQLKFQTVELLSNGETLVGFGQNVKTHYFYDVFGFTPNGIAVYNDLFQLFGTVDLGIPRVSAGYTSMLTFAKPGADIQMQFTAVDFYFEGLGKVAFDATFPQTLDEKGYITEGKVGDPDLFLLNAKLYRQKGKPTRIELLPNQTLNIGAGNTTKMVELTGAMQVLNTTNDWDYFSFQGDLEGTQGVTDENKRLDFTIYGDVVANNQKLGVTNMELPFGKIEITYDYKENRMHGILEVIGKKFGGLGIKQATFEMAVDNQGWYFIGGGDFSASEPVGNIKAGMLIGNYSVLTPEMKEQILQYAYNKNFPASMSNGISGFFITGQKYIEVPIPSFSVDLIIGSAGFGAEAGLDARFWMNFADNFEFGIGAMAYARGWFHASSMLCLDMGFCVTAEMGVTGIYNTGNHSFNINGCGSLGLNTYVEQCTGAEVLGVDACIDPCLSIDIDKALKLNIDINSSGSLKYDLGWGSCSGNQVSSGGCK